LMAVDMPPMPTIAELASAANRQVRAARDRLKPAQGGQR